jgi:RNA polymerase sigma-70 factor (ECF subfamily)
VEYEETLHPVIEKEEMLNNLEASLTTLNVEQRQCIALFYLQKKSYTEIMQETGFNFMQVKSFIQNGKRNLKGKLSQKTDE